MRSFDLGEGFYLRVRVEGWEFISEGFGCFGWRREWNGCKEEF